MDFIVLFVLYCLGSALAVILYLQADSRLLSQGPIGKLRAITFQIFSTLYNRAPRPVREILCDIYDYIFCERNCLFVGLYVILVLVGHVVLVLDAMPYLYAADQETNHIFIPLTLFLANMALFVVSCRSDAGVITAETLSTYEHVFRPDGVMYVGDNNCATCLHTKPARSKHCAISNQCIFKFDHYCAWTNNVVGGLNHRYFLLFLVSLCAMMAHGAVQFATALVNITALYQLMTLQYLDALGQPQPMNFRVLSQTLFMQFPRTVFLLAALCALLIFLSVFTGYHVYLVLTNQTTNERYKKHYLRTVCKKNIERNPYNKGLIGNVLEEIYPLRSHLNLNRKTR